MIRVLSAFLTACVLVLPAFPQEPDDDTRFARAAYLNFEMTTEVSGVDDIDWFRLDVTRPGRLIVSFSAGEEAGALPQFTLTSNDEELALSSLITDDSGTVSQSAIVEPGIHFIGVSSPTVAGEYGFELDLAPLSIGEAYWANVVETPSASGSYPVHLEGSNAPTIFSLEVEDFSTLVIRYENLSDVQTQFAGQVLNTETGETVSILPFVDIGDVDPSAFVPLFPGEYEVQLNRYGAPEGPARVSFSLGAPGDAFEPNDTPDMASHFPLNQSVSDVHTYRGDTDWLSVELDAAGHLEFSFRPVEPTDIGYPTAYLYPEADTNSYISGNWNSQTGILAYSLEAGRYLLRVTGPNAELRTQIRANFRPQQSEDVEETDTNFFIVGLADAENAALQDSISSIASAGGGETIPVSGDDMELGLTLASIVSRSEGRTLTIIDYLRATSQVMLQRLGTPPENDLAAWRASSAARLAETNLFEPQEDSAGDIAAQQAARFRDRMLRYFQPAEPEN
ncbi:hypothetical protein [Ponticaulis sp.]|uniref:hypothetical protein n=1 Tax=Ponticaulis sp. TaxID=2020902 RepID=UPI0026398AB2|nr:hypothetical protein [Ponticaulis sp.]MDF1681597.1 hypothetical protein [Ponticaulis sp.]